MHVVGRVARDYVLALQDGAKVGYGWEPQNFPRCILVLIVHEQLCKIRRLPPLVLLHNQVPQGAGPNRIQPLFNVGVQQLLVRIARVRYEADEVFNNRSPQALLFLLI